MAAHSGVSTQGYGAVERAMIHASGVTTGRGASGLLANHCILNTDSVDGPIRHQERVSCAQRTEELLSTKNLYAINDSGRVLSGGWQRFSLLHDLQLVFSYQLNIWAELSIGIPA